MTEDKAIKAFQDLIEYFDGNGQLSEIENVDGVTMKTVYSVASNSFQVTEEKKEKEIVDLEVKLANLKTEKERIKAKK